MTISNGQIRVIVTQSDGSSTQNIFIGYLNCEAVQQEMLNHADLRFVASGLLKKIEDSNPVEIDTLQNLSLIDILDDCLRQTGSAYNIRVNCSLYELNATLASGQTLFNRSAAFTELFWDNNVDRYSGLKILETILKTFNCILYWYDGYWYVEHYEDLGAALNSPYQKSYVEYTTDTSYVFASAGSPQTVTVGAPYTIHDPTVRSQVGGSQILAVNPGMREIEIRLNQKQYANLINSDLSNITTTTSAIPIPGWREWIAYQDYPTHPVLWSSAGLPWKNMANSITRVDYYVGGAAFYGNGITTSFRMTVKDDTTLTVNWKFGPTLLSDIPGSSALEDYSITHHYWISFTVPFVSTDYVIYNDSSGLWTSGPCTPAICLNTIETSGSDLDPALLTMDVSVTIKVGEALSSSASWEQDYIVKFGIGHEQWDDGIITPVPADGANFGDVTASLSETPDDNVVKGTQNTAFLDKKTIDLDLFDSGWSYRNVVMMGNTLGATWNNRAVDWTYNGVDTDSLAKWLLASKFRLYNVARQKIKIKYMTSEILIPLHLWIDDKQSDKPFVLHSDTYFPDKGEHIIEVSEYDDTEPINFI
jgi:hypothetical protein